MIKKLLHRLKYLNKQILLMFYILLIIIAGSLIVYMTGGTGFPYTHLMYFPIIISAFLFGIKGSVATAILAGIALGPIMPVNVCKGITQEPKDWMLRTIFFVVMALVNSVMLQRIKTDKEILINKSYVNETTGYPNINKLKLDLNKVITQQKSFSMIVFKITNLDQINRYVDYSIGQKSVLKAIEILENIDKGNIYSIYKDEISIVMLECSIENAYLKSKEFLNHFKEPVFIEGFPVNIIIKGGISNFPLHGKKVDDLFKKMGRALDQGNFDENGIFIYDNSIAQKNAEKYDTIISLYDAIKNDKFTIVYQPKINLKRNEVMGFEALLRWNNGIKGNMNVPEFIKAAEDAGIISEITKWVIKNVIDQIKRWQEEGIETKIAINISSKDLKDNSIIEYTRNYIKFNEIDSTMLEFELTERSIIENEDKVGHLLKDIRDIGLKTSLDDFGTGYNSMVNLLKLPIDYIKADKIFIDNINDIHHRLIINDLITLAHNLGKEIIAEGVETKEQTEMLYNMGCDYIQGYYFSKPLPPDEISEFILNFNRFAIA